LLGGGHFQYDEIHVPMTPERTCRIFPGSASMDQIVPRWEWRTFGHEFGGAESKFASLLSEKVQKSEEIYLLAAATDANVKIRDRLMDIKMLERTSPEGLEQWRPVLKESFPLPHTAVATVRATLGLPAASPSGDNLPLDRLLAELAPAGGPVHVVDVRKTRTRYHVKGCVAEVTEVIADGKAVRTVAIEDEDPAKLIAAVRSMGLGNYPNTSYPQGLKQLVGLSSKGAPR
jgi:exopolyphosphatase/guanosine-5'-triphosphate,3'-diphosphate pyrophosphatase